MIALRRPVPILALASFLLLPAGLTTWLQAGSSSPPEIGPGPSSQSDEERAIQPDPEGGTQHGVILIYEVNQDDSGASSVVQAHVRAKILSNEGRDLANVEILLPTEGSKIVKWWGRTIHPDGTVHELPMEQLREQTIAQRGRHKTRVVKGLLPAVEAGCVIDFGYTRRDKVWQSLVRLSIEDRWPARRILYRWTPLQVVTPAATLRKESNLDVSLTREGRSYLLSARNVPAAIQEPLGPPEYETSSAATFYYIFFGVKDAADFWNAIAEWTESQVHAFGSFNVPVFRAIDKMQIPDGASLETKLHTAYEWISKNARATERQSIEEMELGSKKSVEKFRTAGAVLSAGAGTSFQLDLLFISIARAMGAEAELILATDRTAHEWHRNLLTLDQFDDSLVAVRPRGAPPEEATILDVGSGLPYGEIPWWLSGGKAMAATAKGAREVQLKPSPADRNISETKGSVSALDVAEGRIGLEWTRTGTGQTGYQERLELRSLGPEERLRRLAEMCGDGGDLEITVAQAPDLEDLAKPFHARCSGEAAATLSGRGADEVVLRLEGPWFAPVPEVPNAPRHLPILLPHARVDRASIEFKAPPGFAATAPPDPVEITSPFGSYRLEIAATDAGYRVEREIKIGVDKVQPGTAPVFVRFLSQVRTADHTSLRFVRPADGVGGP